MELLKLTEQNINALKGKNICCFERSSQYLTELFLRFDLLNSVSYIVDDNIRNQGNFEFAGKQMKVVASNILETENLNDMAIIITSDYHMEAFEQLCRIKNVKDTLNVVYRFLSKETEFDEQYRELYRDDKLEDVIIFRSGPHSSSYIKGTDYSDNARALFEYMVANGYNKKYRLVWMVKYPMEFAKYKKENVEFISFDWSESDNKVERDLYYRILCLAKYIFFTDAYGFARNCRPDQTRMQLWHGCGFKNRVNFVRCEHRYEYTTVISDLYAKIHEEIYGLRSDQLLVTGYAKQDWLFQSPEQELHELFDIIESKKYIFWMPTFRMAEKTLSQLNEYELESETGLPIINTAEKMELINHLLKETGCFLIIKLHPFQNTSLVKCENLSNVKLLNNKELFQKDLQINRLLAEADALISDYSSAAVDFMLLDRPIAFTLEDVGEYANSRGFVFDNIEQWLPGMEIYTFEDFYTFLHEVAKNIDSTMEKRRKLTIKMHKYYDGNNCKRIVEAIKL